MFHRWLPPPFRVAREIHWSFTQSVRMNVIRPSSPSMQIFRSFSFLGSAFTVAMKLENFLFVSSLLRDSRYPCWVDCASAPSGADWEKRKCEGLPRPPDPCRRCLPQGTRYDSSSKSALSFRIKNINTPSCMKTRNFVPLAKLVDGTYRLTTSSNRKQKE